jgi:peptidoglycan hydrolase-like protein with peptidoglycan-binding domain
MIVNFVQSNAVSILPCDQLSGFFLFYAKQAQARGDDTSLPYADVLMRREQTLWERQEELARSQTAHFESSFKSLLSQHKALQEQAASERAAWEAKEQRLIAQCNEIQQENHELRQLLLQTLRRAPSSAQGQTSMLQGNDTPVHAALPTYDSSKDTNTRIHAEKSSATEEASPTSVAQQFHDRQPHGTATRPSENSPTAAATTASAAFKPNAPLPSWASELQAAMAAVDDIDVLTEGVDYSAIAAAAANAAAAARASAPGVSTGQQALDNPEHAPSTPTQHMGVSSTLRQSGEASAVGSSFEPQPTTPAPQPDAVKGPPPTLSLGADDIFWVNQLHTSLADAGFYAGDEDIDDYYFGEGTQSAVLTYQCCEGLTETGVVDEAMWKALLGFELRPRPSKDLFDDNGREASAPSIATTNTHNNIDANSNIGNTSSTHSLKQHPKPYAELFSSVTATSTSIGPHGELEIDQVVREDDTIEFEDGSVTQESTTVSSHFTNTWPVLMDGDGGREVHSLHVAMSRQGYHVGDDDLYWWQFGDGTINALKTFQACSGLPETGVCDVTTWKRLLGEDAEPSDLASLRSGNSDDEDLSHSNSGHMVWLMGEQRWEDRSRMKNRGFLR